MVIRGAPKTRDYVVGKIEHKLFERGKQKLKFYYRPGSSDDSVLHEILTTHWYRRAKLGFDVHEDEHWLDLGANIGGFALYCWLHGATATCYEPLDENFNLLRRNFDNIAGFDVIKSAVTHNKASHVQLYRGRSEFDFARYTTDKTRNEVCEVTNTYIGSKVLKRVWDGIKIDIEAAEHPILDAKLLPRCNKLVLEYHIRKDPNMANFRRRMDYLRTMFKTVHYAPSLDKGYPDDKYPGAFDRMIFCLNPK